MAGDPAPDHSGFENWRGGTDKSTLRTLMNMTPGLRIIVRQVLRVAADVRGDVRGD
jgi:hypothetical protein